MATPIKALEDMKRKPTTQNGEETLRKKNRELKKRQKEGG